MPSRFALWEIMAGFVLNFAVPDYLSAKIVLCDYWPMLHYLIICIVWFLLFLSRLTISKDGLLK